MNRTYLGQGPFCLCVFRSQYIASSISLFGIKGHIEVLLEVFYKDFVTTFNSRAMRIHARFNCVRYRNLYNSTITPYVYTK